VGTVTFIFAYIPTVFVWGHISIVLHELGHFYAAKVLGMEPIRIKVGAGPRLAAFEFFGRPIDYFLVPTYGMTYVSIGTLRRLRTKLVLLSLAGPVVNFILIASLIRAMILVARTDGFFYDHIEFFFFILLMESIIVIANLAPVNHKIDGVITPSDGKSIFQAVILPKSRLVKRTISELITALNVYAETETDKNIEALNGEQALIELYLNGSIAMVRREYHKAIPLFEKLLESPLLGKREQAFLLDMMASTALYHQKHEYLSAAQGWSERATQLLPNLATLKGTRGAILIESGFVNEGLNLLKPLIALGNRDLDRLVSAAFVAKGESIRGNRREAEKYLSLAKSLPDPIGIVRRIESDILKT
jgi:hypothetical protein